MPDPDYLKINKEAWNRKTPVHIDSEFYDVKSFLKGQSSLNRIELDLLGDVQDKKIMHLQCHFGMDTLSLARMGAQVSGVDFSEEAIKYANKLAEEANLKGKFYCLDVYSVPEKIKETYDIVFLSYGTIGWLPDIDRYAKVISGLLKPGGRLVFVDFHPVIWMYDGDFKEIEFSYFKDGPILEEETGTYADRSSDLKIQTIGWNHSIEEVVGSLLNNQIELTGLKEYDYSPYNCFRHMKQSSAGKYRIEGLEGKLPMVYAVTGVRKH
ncbi:MAG: class I SAM-dependent methyltransferase [Flavobacteriales bacterium]|nr:class I SAM-dependent methyltransferase [Flavobacteriales bacterium]